MNISKTKAMWIGASKNSSERPLDLEWCSGVKTLGIHFSCDQRVRFERLIVVWQSDHHKNVPYTKAVICFYNIGNSRRNHQTDGEDDI